MSASRAEAKKKLEYTTNFILSFIKSPSLSQSRKKKSYMQKLTFSSG